MLYDLLFSADCFAAVKICYGQFIKSLTTSEARIRPATEGVNAVLPGSARLADASSASSKGIKGCSVE